MLDAAGFDLVLIETVGTGQSEVEVAAAADTTVVLEAPEMGDEVQAIKAGLLEVADLVVVNKGDKPGAQRTAAQLRAMLVAVGRPRPDVPDRPAAPKRPEVLITTAATGEGVPELLAALDRHRARRTPSAPSEARRRRGPTAQVRAILAERLGRPARRPGPRAERDVVIWWRWPPTSSIPTPRPTGCWRPSHADRRELAGRGEALSRAAAPSLSLNAGRP